jgi:cytochrome c556
MIRATLAAAVIAIGVTAVAAHSSKNFDPANPVDQRAMLMHKQADIVYGTFKKMVRGQAPYDQAKVDEGFAALKEIAPKLPELYPATAKGRSPDSDYYASDKVWENKAEFDAHFKKLIAAIDANAPKATSLDGLQAARKAVAEACDSCHETYRVKKN